MGLCLGNGRIFLDGCTVTLGEALQPLVNQSPAWFRLDTS